MAQIRILSPHVANRIAAGEVVDRPASVLKELLDNAVDGNARQIDVTVRGDGRTLLVVSDDGFGIAAEDLATALERHATSKITGDDIHAIRTLGFRGEALPSIGAVASLKIVSRAESSDCAWEIACDAGKIGEAKPAALARGTRVEVRDLFRCVPARLKFLRSPRAEAAVLRETFDMLALANPAVSFTFAGDQTRIVHAADKDDPELARTRSVMGESFLADAVRVLAEIDSVRVTGWACVPTRNRADAKEQAVFVNGRYVRDRGLASALRSAYAGLLSKGRQPCAVIRIELDPGRVDVNVHPSKEEIRFSDEQAVFGIVRDAVKAALSTTGVRTSTEIGRQAIDALSAAPLVSPSDSLRLPLGRVIGQVHGCFVISETLDGIAVVDQHAAHERILLEQLKNAVLDGGVPSCLLPSPVDVHLPPVQAALIADRAGDLARLGLVVTPAEFGVTVAAVPEMLGGANPVCLVEDVAAALEEDPAADVLTDRLEEVCSLIACHNAVRATDALDREAADRLLREMEGCLNAAQCNHGRPTVAFLSRRDLETLFDRK